MNMPVAMPTGVKSRTLECGEALPQESYQTRQETHPVQADEPFLRTTPQLRTTPTSRIRGIRRGLLYDVLDRGAGEEQTVRRMVTMRL